MIYNLRSIYNVWIKDWAETIQKSLSYNVITPWKAKAISELNIIYICLNVYRTFFHVSFYIWSCGPFLELNNTSQMFSKTINCTFKKEIGNLRTPKYKIVDRGCFVTENTDMGVLLQKILTWVFCYRKYWHGCFVTENTDIGVSLQKILTWVFCYRKYWHGCFVTENTKVLRQNSQNPFLYSLWDWYQ